MKRLFPVLLIIISCGKTDSTLIPVPPAGDRFSNVPLNYILTRPIPEASGIADSKTFVDHLWVLEDSGNPARLYLLKHEGYVTDSFLLDGGVNRDWEDIALAKGPDEGVNYLYIGDIGDNDLKYASYNIYRMPEPKNFNDVITGYDSINFMYPDGPHDAEALMIDDNTKDIYVITKRDATSKVYRIPYPQDTQNMNQAQFVSDLPFAGVVSATLSLAGTEVIVKTYTTLFYYARIAKEGLTVTLGKNPTDTLAYQPESQGEAVAFANNNSGFFTLSEKGLSDKFPNLMYYRRTR
ncbi:MAG TPA: hypothetical protein VM101_02340 [Flavitalea sp.]|nr:hypothetical protein [Flavitalea sp.]